MNNPKISLRKQLLYFWKSSWQELLTTIVVFLVAMLLVQATNDDAFDFFTLDSWYGKWGDPILTVTTLLIAIFVWFNSKRKSWEETLPKKLNVHFSFEGKYVYSCYLAPLLYEDDGRALGQQIGSQMNGKENLTFSPFIRSNPSSIQVGQDGSYYRLYEIDFTCTEEPDNAETNQYLIWKVHQDKQHEHQAIVKESRPAEPALLTDL